jgi:hypothetical protein
MLELRITASSVEELNAKLLSLLPKDKVQFKVTLPGVEAISAPVSEDKPVKKKKAKKKASVKASPAPQVSEEPKEENKNLTADDTYKALQEVNATCSISVARSVLNDFDVERISALQEKDYDAFIKACKAKCAEA